MRAIPLEIITFTPTGPEKYAARDRQNAHTTVSVDGLTPSSPVTFYTADMIKELSADPEAWAQHSPAIRAQIARGAYTAERIKELSADPEAWAQHSPVILGYLIAAAKICPTCGGLKPRRAGELVN